MSQQQCLPLPRRRKRQDDDDNNNEGLRSGSTSIDHLASMDAMEYLAAVSREATHMPEYFTSTSASASTSTTHATATALKRKEGDSRNNSKEDYHPHVAVSYLLSNEQKVMPPPTPHHLPIAGKAWVDQVLAEFTQLHSYMEQVAAAEKTAPSPKHRIPVPPMKDQMGWHVFCVGAQEASGNIGGYFQDDSDSEDDHSDDGDSETHHSDAEQDQNKWDVRKVPEGGHVPTVSLLLQLDQVMTRRALEHHAHYMMTDGVVLTSQRGAWIYGLLARLDQPLPRNDEHTLRQLLRNCTQRRSRLIIPEQTSVAAVAVAVTLPGGTDVKTTLATLNTLLVVIGIYFEQEGGGYNGILFNPPSSSNE